jgi:2-amino-4-hydroxy-6-hydroxymethyldihydropteridine diphosphokinase
LSAAGRNLAGCANPGGDIPDSPTSGEVNPATNLHTVYLGFGSNIAPEANLPEALEQLAQVVTILAVSTTWQTPAVGSPGPDYLNTAVSIRTSLSWEDLKIRVIRPIEEGLGRVRTADKNSPRTIDIDILVDETEGETTLVDPSLWSDAHKAVPLAELIPGYQNAEGNLTLAQAAEQLKLTARVTPRPEVLPQR